MVRVQLSIFLLLLQGDIIVANSQLAANGPNAAIASGTNILIGAVTTCTLNGVTVACP